MNNPHVKVLLQLTPEMIQGFTLDQTFMKLGRRLLLNAEELQICQWQISLLEKRRDFLTEMQAYEYAMRQQMAIKQILSSLKGLPPPMKTKDVNKHVIQQKKTGEGNSSKNFFLGFLSACKQIGSLMKPYSNHPQNQQRSGFLVESDEQRQSFLFPGKQKENTTCSTILRPKRNEKSE